jgi:hypothetical protein
MNTSSVATGLERHGSTMALFEGGVMPVSICVSKGGKHDRFVHLFAESANMHSFRSIYNNIRRPVGKSRSMI